MGVRAQAQPKKVITEAQQIILIILVLSVKKAKL